MRKYLVLALVLVLTFGIGSIAWGADTAEQTVTYEVDTINEISVSGDPEALIISTATAGSQPTDATDDSTTYAITTNGSTMKITGAIDSAMPTGTTLKVKLAAPSVGTSVGDVVLTATAADLVTGISKVAESGKTITYTFSATVSAGVVTSAYKTVTFTLTSGA